MQFYFYYVFFCLFVQNAGKFPLPAGSTYLAFLNYWLSNHNPGASKPSKSPGDYTQLGPHQPHGWIFWYSRGFEPTTFQLRVPSTTPITDCSTSRRYFYYVLIVDLHAFYRYNFIWTHISIL